MPTRSRVVDIAGLVLFVALCLGIGALGSALTEASVKTWYAGLAKPSFTPPDAVFGPVWTVLYILMGLAAWRVAHRRPRHRARTADAVRAAAGDQSRLECGVLRPAEIGAAVATVVVLWVAVLVTMLAFRTVDRVAAC